MLDLARVVATHPESNCVDLVLLTDGQLIAGVQVMSGSAGAAHGLHDLPQPVEQDLDAADPFSAAARGDTSRLTLAVVAFYGTSPLVLGFLFPQVAQCLFKERDRMVYRHASDVYFTIDAAGNTEFAHPSGAFLRIGESAAHEDLTGRDADGTWAIARNTGRAPHLRLHLANTDIHADPAGNVTVVHNGALVVNTAGNATVTAGGNVEVDSGGTTRVISAGAATVQAPTVTLDAATTTCTGALVVQGAAHFVAAVLIDGLLTTTGGRTSTGAETSNGKRIDNTHTHGGVRSGGDISAGVNA